MALSALVFVVWFALFPPPEQAPSPDPSTAAAQNEPAAVAAPDAGEPGAVAAEAAEDLGPATEASAPRVAIDTPSLTGSLSLQGGRIDDLSLKGYRVTLDGPELVQLLTPPGSPFPYYVVSGWQAGAGYQPGQPNFAAIQAWNAASVYQRAIALMGRQIDGGSD